MDLDFYPLESRAQFREMSLIAVILEKIYHSYQNPEIPYISAKSPTTAENDLWRAIVIRLYGVNAHCSRRSIHLAIATFKRCRQSKIRDLGNHLPHPSQIKRSEVVMAAIDGSAGGWVGLVLHGHSSSLLLDKFREDIFVFKGH